MLPKHLFTIAMIYLSFCFVCVNLCFGQTYWKKSYGSGLYCIQPTDDGNFLMVGWEAIIKIKPNGDTIWTKNCTDEVFLSIQPTDDGNFLLVGRTMNAVDGLIVKIRPNGDTIWTKTYGGVMHDDIISTIQPTKDGNFMLAGYSDGVNGWLLKIRPNGDTIWTKNYKALNIYSFNALQPTSDNNFLLTGTIGPGRACGFLVKIKSNGDTVWSKTYRGAGSFFSVQPTDDGNFLLAGFTQDTDEFFISDLLVKINPNGDTIWTKTYGKNKSYNSSSYTILPSNDGNFLLAYYDDTKGWLAKINPNGDTIWTETFDRSDFAAFFAIQPTNDGNFLVAGYGGISILCIIADQYAYKNTLFTYKIPTNGIDTLNFGYAPLKVPSGMTVSAGGTVSWTPRTDSAYMDHAEFLVFNDMGRKDTLTFNIFVNSDYHTPVLARPSQTSKFASTPFDFAATSFPGYVKFLLPPTSVCLSIYDISGRIVDKITPVASTSASSFIWPVDHSGSSNIHAGKYFVKATTGNNSVVKAFALER